MDLYILRDKFANISSLPLTLMSEIDSQSKNIRTYYSGKIELAGRNAGWLVTDEFLFFGKIVQQSTGEVLIVGPASEYFLSAELKREICRQLGYKGRKASEFSARLDELPIMRLTDFIGQLSLLNYIINDDSTTIIQTQTSAPSQPESIPNNQEHSTAEFEEFVFRCVEFGQVERLKEMLSSQQMNQYSTGIRANSIMRAQKNIFIVATTLISRAAIRGGLDYDTALSISDRYIYVIEEVRTYDEFSRLLYNMMIEFAQRVADLELYADASPTVRAAVRLINRQLYGKIRVEQLADDLSLSRSYLSHLFISETGISLSDYIAKRKIHEAIRLMETTDMSLADIAYRLAFSSQSHFHSTFKKITGDNPGKYPRR